MKILELITIDDSVLQSSSVPENDEPVWSGATTYNLGDRVIVVSTHSIYESVQGSNLNNDPTTDNGTWWTRVSSTNRWKALDQTVSTATTSASDITYTFLMPTPSDGNDIDGVGVFNIAGDADVQIKVRNTVPTEIYNQTHTSNETELVITGIPASPGYEMDVIISRPSGTRNVGEIALGQVRSFGDTLTDTTLSMQSYSSKDPDVFGDRNLIKRGFSRRADYRFAIPPTSARFVARTLERVDGEPVVFFSGLSTQKYGEIIYGLHLSFEIPLTAGRSICSLEVESL